MNKYLKVIVLILILVLLLSPLISLISPEKLKHHVYRRLIDHVIVDKETKSCRSDEERALRLFDYVVRHEFPQGRPYPCKPLESLVYGEALCDFQARTLNVLLSVAKIPSRYAMLMDKNGNSPHTLNEVFLNKRWRVFDPSINIVFADQEGKKLSLEELSSIPGLLDNHPKLKALKGYNIQVYKNVLKLYSSILPMPSAPKRSTPLVFQTHIIDHIVDVYFRIFKYGFFNRNAEIPGF